MKRHAFSLFAGLWLAGCLGVASPAGLVTLGSDGGTRPPDDADDAGGGQLDGSAPLDGGAPLDAGALADGGVAPDGGSASADGGTLRVPMFVAQGHLGRTVRSRDLGRTWVDDQSDVGPLDRCWTTAPDGGVEYECDHQPNAGRGIAYGGGWWVANFGWGPVGTVRRSTDGVEWERVDAGQNFASMSYVGGEFFASDVYPRRSVDLGRSWASGGVIPDVWTTLSNVRRGSAGELGGPLFVVAADKGIAVGRPVDGGVGWTLPTVPSTCRAPMTQGGVVVAAGRAVLVSAEGVACVSTDGASFTTASVGGSVKSHLVFDGARFRAWGSGVAFESMDGLSWTSTPTRLTGASGTPDIGPVAYGAGVFVAVTGTWGAWYDTQRFYRSADGVAWEVLSDTAAPGGHPIINIAFGEGG